MKKNDEGAGHRGKKARKIKLDQSLNRMAFSGMEISKDLVVKRIRELLLSGAMDPGMQISENRISKDLNISIVPVREAFAELIAVGVLIKVPRVGSFVREFGRTDLIAIFDLRSFLMSYCTQGALDSCSDENMAVALDYIDDYYSYLEQAAEELARGSAFREHFCACLDLADDSMLKWLHIFNHEGGISILESHYRQLVIKYSLVSRYAMRYLSDEHLSRYMDCLILGGDAKQNIRTIAEQRARHEMGEYIVSYVARLKNTFLQAIDETQNHPFALAGAT